MTRTCLLALASPSWWLCSGVGPAQTAYATAPRGSRDDLRRNAEMVSTLPKFEQCVASGTPRAAVQRDVEERSRLGVSGTPVFLINGRLVSPALSRWRREFA
jgi:protein-disulfide isomerase